MSKESYKGKVAIVTGGSRGIGFASAGKLAELGYDIAICSRNTEELEDIAEKVKLKGVQCFFKEVDVSEESQIISFVKDTNNVLGRIDILVNNVGMQLNKPFLELTSAEWRSVLTVNLDSYFLFCKHVGGYMIEQKSGKIINISSVLSKFALPGRAPYSVSKAGIEALTRVLASEWARYNVLVNGIAPGHIDTELVRRDIKKGLLDENKMKERSVLSRIGKAEEVGDVVAFLSSDKSSYITGQTFVIDGGFSIKK